MSGAALFADMGTGKTGPTIALIKQLGVHRTLVLCPKAVLTSNTWSSNAVKLFDDPPRVYEGIPHPGWTIKDRLRRLQEQIAQTRPPVVVVLNYDVLDYEYVISWINKHRFEMLILDESHKLKSVDGKRARAYWKISQTIKYRLALTGTPMPHSPKDIWSQFRGLDVGVFGPTFARFEDRYAVKGGYGGKEIVKWKNQEELSDKMYQIAYRVGSEILDLPPVRHEEVPIELGPKAIKVYEAIDDDFYAQIDEGNEVTVANVLIQILRQQQITSGFIKNDDGELIRLDTGKQDALDDILSKIQPPTVDANGRRVEGEPLVVFCKFRHDLDVVKESAEKAGFIYAELSGRKSELKQWTEGEADVIGVQIQSGGSGISLVRARYCVYYSVGYSLGDYLQSLKRIHRPEQVRPVTYYHLVARGFIDSDVYSALQSHADIVDVIVDKIKERRPIAHVVGAKNTRAEID